MNPPRVFMMDAPGAMEEPLPDLSLLSHEPSRESITPPAAGDPPVSVTPDSDLQVYDDLPDPLTPSSCEHYLRVALEAADYDEFQSGGGYARLEHAAARAHALAVIQALDLNRMLQPAVQHDTSSQSNLLACAARTSDVALLEALAVAGARPGPDEDVYSNLNRKQVYRAAREIVCDDDMAAALTALHARGVRPPRGSAQVMPSSLMYASRGALHCVRVMVECIDPHWRTQSHSNGTLLHAAAEGCHANVCTYLMQLEPSGVLHARNSIGITPAGSCLATGADLNALLDTLAVVAAAPRPTSDVRPALRECGLFATADMVKRILAQANCLYDHVHVITCVRSVSSLPRVRIMMHIAAVVRAYPVAFQALLLLRVQLSQDLSRSSGIFLCSDPMDVHSLTAPGVYIPDPYRLTGDVQQAIRFVSSLDTLQRRSTSSTHSASEASSKTLRLWAWMRRRQAAAGRVKRLHTASA